MNNTESEGILLTELRRIQQSCRQGLISDKELTGFIRIVREVKSCIERQQSQYRSLYKNSSTQSPAEHLELSYADLEAGTHVKSYVIKKTFKESAYAGPRTYVKYRNEQGYDVGRDEGRTAWYWYDLEGSECGACHFSIVNTNGSQFGQILEHLKEIIYWHSLRFLTNEEGVFRLEFTCEPKQAAKRFGKAQLHLTNKSVTNIHK